MRPDRSGAGIARESPWKRCSDATTGEARRALRKEAAIVRETHLSLPELALIAGTRAMGGAGLGLLLADRLSDSRRKAVGWTLLLVGAATTVPLAMQVLGASRSAIASDWADSRPGLSHTRSG
jgi:hypothetical protein